MPLLLVRSWEAEYVFGDKSSTTRGEPAILTASRRAASSLGYGPIATARPATSARTMQRPAARFSRISCTFFGASWRHFVRQRRSPGEQGGRLDLARPVVVRLRLLQRWYRFSGWLRTRRFALDRNEERVARDRVRERVRRIAGRRHLVHPL